MNRSRAWFDRHRNELLLIVILVGIATGILFWLAGLERPTKGQTVLDRFALAVLVAVVVRSIALFFSLSERQVGDYRSSKAEYEEAVRSANASVWVAQTWLPGFAAQATDILNPRRSDTRIMLASFKEGSFIFSRILGREEANTPEAAKHNVAQCAALFQQLVPEGKLRFAFGHHPGWITIIDCRDVFWGPTPIQKDNNSSTEPACWNRDEVKGEQGRFWLEQFNLLWNKYSHPITDEVQHNAALKRLTSLDQQAAQQQHATDGAARRS